MTIETRTLQGRFQTFRGHSKNCRSIYLPFRFATAVFWNSLDFILSPNFCLAVGILLILLFFRGLTVLIIGAVSPIVSDKLSEGIKLLI